MNLCVCAVEHVVFVEQHIVLYKQNSQEFCRKRGRNMLLWLLLFVYYVRVNRYNILNSNFILFLNGT